jgi:hypothetical protein
MSANTQPYPSWKFDESTNQWIAPIPKPLLSNVAIRWDEAHGNWKCSKKIYSSWTLKQINDYGETLWAPPINRPPYVEGVVQVELWDEENQTWQVRDSLI